MSNAPVRRTTRTTRATRDTENLNARPSRIMTRAKSQANGAATGKSELPANRSVATTAASRAKAVENPSEKTMGKRKREVLTEVTEVNKDKAKSKMVGAGKGKEKEKIAVKSSGDTGSNKSKNVSKSTRQPLRQVGGTLAQQSLRARKLSQTNDDKIVEEDTTARGPSGPFSSESEDSKPASLNTRRRESSRLQTVPEDDSDPPSKRRHTEGPGSAPEIKRTSSVLVQLGESREDEEQIATELIGLQDEGEDENEDEGVWDDLDVDDMDDPLMVAEYVVEIASYMKNLEAKCLPTPDYMKYHSELDWQKREILLDWILQLHARYNFLPETFFLCVNIMDRFLSLRTAISIDRIQLMGISCFSIAAKFEEGVSPSIQELVRLTGNAYTSDQLCSAERYVLKTIKYDLSYPGPMSWLRRGSKADELDPGARTIAKYLLEVACFESDLVSAPASLIAAASLWFARLVLGREEWTANLAHYTTYKERELLPTANVLFNHVIRELQPNVNDSLYKKYAAKRYMKCSLYIRKWALSRFEVGSKVELREVLPVIKAEIREERAAKIAGEYDD
ncbi:hypothetical protein K435DRAFT_829264 [Dendrothele bispora CBS 962.96]|uniref:Uncharacterized protein n=1 Tax=Dendrothele bispora (strain CBS 962.96) TaxID=1314807 RepID=A0A4S8LYG1_DENBC|nr:hypothetical protein K435DRAFT_829264 [Dendrothele bispora CBS 962.96]